MTTISFRSDRPDLGTPGKDSTDPSKVAIALAYERAMRSPAFFNKNDPGHYKALEDVEKFGRALFGDEPLAGGQPFGVSTISSVDGSVIERTLLGTPTVATGGDNGDEHNKV
jgi:hypothetical protein